MISQIQLIGPFKQLLPMNGLPLRGALAEATLNVIPNGGILVKNDKILAVDTYSQLQKKATSLKATIYLLEKDYVGLPGFIDAHTHICFAGSRAMDYAARNAGVSYLDIAKAGGGIWSTVEHTRAASQEELENGIIRRANRHLREGVTTIEVKSGYGLSYEAELKMLYAIKSANAQHSCDLIPTCLAAHILPKDFAGTEKDYLNHLLNDLLPQIQQEHLSNRVDIFIEDTAFSKKGARDYLKMAKKLGFSLTAHADQFSIGGSQIAIETGAISADHLEASGQKEIEELAESKVIPVALPGASLGIGCDFAPARKLLDAGCSLAIASDWNPGSAPMGDLLMQAAVLGVYQKLSSAEIFAALTFRAAAALGLTDRGILAPNKLADFIAFPCSDYREILYHQGKIKPEEVWKRGTC